MMIYSNNILLILIIIIPFLITLSFGFSLYNSNNLGSNYKTNYGLMKYRQGHPFRTNDESNFTNQIYNQYFKVPQLNNNLNQIKKARFIKAFHNTFSNISKISIFIGSIISIITVGNMVQEGHIIYLIVNKKTKLTTFVHTFTKPLPYLIFVSFLSSLGISILICNSFIHKSFLNMFLISNLFILTSLLFGYMIGTFLSLSLKNSNLTILLTLLLIFLASMIGKGELVLMPYKYIYMDLFLGIGFRFSSYQFFGLFIMLTLLPLSYLLFIRRDHY